VLEASWNAPLKESLRALRVLLSKEAVEARDGESCG
jgi:hypothetical protein